MNIYPIQPPADVPKYAWPAWFDCLLWALYEPEIRNKFTADSGISYSPPKSGLEAVIDEASGFDPAEKFIMAFVPWFNANIWGLWNEEKAVEQKQNTQN
jgi:hypothetical protein